MGSSEPSSLSASALYRAHVWRALALKSQSKEPDEGVDHSDRSSPENAKPVDDYQHARLLSTSRDSVLGAFPCLCALYLPGFGCVGLPGQWVEPGTRAGLFTTMFARFKSKRFSYVCGADLTYENERTEGGGRGVDCAAELFFADRKYRDTSNGAPKPAQRSMIDEYLGCCLSSPLCAGAKR